MQDEPKATCSSEAPTRKAALLLFALAILLHLVLLLYFFPPRLIFSTSPVSNIDYSIHYHQVDRGIRAYAGWGKLWSYDPQLLAGQIPGVIEDMSRKSMVLFAIGLRRIGVHPARAFNLYILIVLLLVPFVGTFAARLFGFAPLQRSLVALLWVLLWFFDSFIHWNWICGMITWSAVSYLAILLVALLYRTLESGKNWLWLAVAALSSLLVFVHPYGSLIAALPCAVLFFRQRRRWIDYGGLGLTLVAIAATSSLWLFPLVHFWHYVMDSSNFLRPTPLYLLYDFLDLLKEPWDTGGGPVRTVFRFLCLAAALICFLRWRKEKDRRLLPLGVLVGALLLYAYAGGSLWIARQTQPYRYIIPAVLAAALPAAVVLCELLSPANLRKISVRGKLLLLLCAIALLPRVALTVLFYLPEALPVATKPVPGSNPTDPVPEPLNGLYGQRPEPMRLHGTPAAFLHVKDWLEEHRDRGRVLVQDWILSEYLVWATDLPIIGGIEERNVHHVDAQLFRWHPDGDLPGEALREYLERYAIGHVVVSKLKPALEWRKDLLQFVALVDGLRIYKTRIDPSYFLRGEGRVVSQSLNSIRVDNAAGEDLVLRFHWLETLRCRPDCRVERFPLKEDRVGFIRVPKPPPAFEIYNGYTF